jgi:DNA polymerase-4
MRKILHADCDCFYAAVEMLRHPEWREVPIAIGGRTE